jgi:hypothetical protein
MRSLRSKITMRHDERCRDFAGINEMQPGWFLMSRARSLLVIASGAKQSMARPAQEWIASSLSLLAMTAECGKTARRANQFGLSECDVKLKNKKYFAFQKRQIRGIFPGIPP